MALIAEAAITTQRPWAGGAGRQTATARSLSGNVSVGWDLQAMSRKLKDWGYYVMATRESAYPPSWRRQIVRRGKPMGVRIDGGGFTTYQAARLAGSRALADFLEQLADRMTDKPQTPRCPLAFRDAGRQRGLVVPSNLALARRRGPALTAPTHGDAALMMLRRYCA